MADTANVDVNSVLALSDDDSLALLRQMLEAKQHLAQSVAQMIIPTLTFAPARAITEARFNGIIKSFDVNKGYGFIACPEMKEAYSCDVWLNQKQCGAFSNGCSVDFAVLINKDGKPQAFDLKDMQQDGGLAEAWWDPAGKGKMKGAMQAEAWWDPASKGKMKGAMQAEAWWDPVAKGNSKGAMQMVGQAPAGLKRPHTSGEAGQRYAGTIKSFAAEKGFGFIDCPELFEAYGRDTWLHNAQLQHFQVGEMVEFTMTLNKTGNPQALDLAPPSQTGKKAKGKGTGGKAVVQHQSVAEGQRYSGTIKSFNTEKGFGFIECPDLFEAYGRDTWLHNAQLQHFQVGEMVEFTMALGKDGNPQAQDLAPPSQMGQKAKGKGTGGKAAAQHQSGAEGQRCAGTIKNFSAEKGFGFIECPELFEAYGRDTWLHHAQVQHFQVGELVEFTMALGKDGNPQALDLSLPGTAGGGKGAGGKAAVRASPMGVWKSTPVASKSAQPLKGDPSEHGGLAGSSEPAVGEQYSGTVKSFMAEKNFGFIDCPALKEAFGRDTWVHGAQVGSFQVGDSVVFSMTLNQQGHPQAINLEPSQV